MSTPIESQTVTENVSLPSEAIQSTISVGPNLHPPSMTGGHTDKAPNFAENTTLQEDIYHYYKLWRPVAIITIDPSQTGNLYNFDLTHDNFLKLFGDLGLPGRVGYKYDLEFRVQIFSSSTQQGAISITTLPYTDDLLSRFCETFQNDEVPSYQLPFLSQYNFRIIPLGRDTETIVPLRWNSIFPFHLSKSPFNTIFHNRMFIKVLSHLSVVEGGHNTCEMVIQARCSDISFIGSAWSDKTQMGQLVLK